MCVCVLVLNWFLVLGSNIIIYKMENREAFIKSVTKWYTEQYYSMLVSNKRDDGWGGAWCFCCCRSCVCCEYVQCTHRDDRTQINFNYQTVFACLLFQNENIAFDSDLVFLPLSTPTRTLAALISSSFAHRYCGSTILTSIQSIEMLQNVARATAAPLLFLFDICTVE